MGNSNASAQNYPSITQDIITNYNISDYHFHPDASIKIIPVKAETVKHTISIYIYIKTFKLDLKDNNLSVYFKYKANCSCELNLYIGLDYIPKKLPSFNTPIYTCTLDNNADEFNCESIPLNDEYYQKIFYNNNYFYIPLTIAVGKDPDEYLLIYCGFIDLKETCKLSYKITGNYISIRSTIYSLKEVYNIDGESKNICSVCLSNINTIVILPCYHLCICSECIDSIIKFKQTCPICRCQINGVVEVNNNKDNDNNNNKDNDNNNNSQP